MFHVASLGDNGYLQSVLRRYTSVFAEIDSHFQIFFRFYTVLVRTLTRTFARLDLHLISSRAVRDGAGLFNPALALVCWRGTRYWCFQRFNPEPTVCHCHNFVWRLPYKSLLGR